MMNSSFELYCEQSALQTDRLILAYESVTKSAEIDFKEASTRYIYEACNRDDFLDLYTEAENKTSEKQQNILTRIWESIKKFFRKIRDAITGKKASSKIDDNAQYPVSKKRLNFFKKGLKGIKVFFSKIGSGIKKLGPAKIIAIAIATIGGFVGIRAIVKKFSSKGVVPESNVSKVEAIEDKVAGQIPMKSTTSSSSKLNPKSTPKADTVIISGKEVKKCVEEANKVLENGEKSIDVMETATKKEGVENSDTLKCVNDIYRACATTVQKECTALIAVSPVVDVKRKEAQEKRLKNNNIRMGKKDWYRQLGNQSRDVLWGSNSRDKKFISKSYYDARDLGKYVLPLKENKAIEKSISRHNFKEGQKKYGSGKYANKKRRTGIGPQKAINESVLNALECSDTYKEFVENVEDYLINIYGFTYEAASEIMDKYDLGTVFEYVVEDNGDIDDILTEDSYVEESFLDDDIDDLLNDF